MKFLFFFCCVSALFVVSCSDDTIDTANVRILLTDMPSTRYDSVIVYLHQVNMWCGCPSIPDEVLSTEHQRIDLLTLRNGVTRLVGSGQPKADNYEHIKLYLDSGYVMKNGVRTTLDSIAGVADIAFYEVFEPGKSYDMILDIDVARSIKINSGGKLSFKPVGRAVLKEKTGALRGSVNKWATVWATMPADTNRDTLTTYTLASAPSDSFAFGFMKPGTYTIGAIDSTGQTSPTQTQVVTTGVVKEGLTITIP